MANRFTEYNYDETQLTAVSGYWAFPLVALEKALEPFLATFNQLDRSIRDAKKHCHFPSEHGLTRDEAAALHLYTMEAGEYSFYLALNKILRDNDRRRVIPWFPFLKLFDTALEKLPIVKGCIWRGVSRKVSTKYQKDQVLTWWSVTSCSSSVQVVKSFLNADNSCTLFMIEALNGKDISKYTIFPNEEEVILKIGTKLRVKNNAMEYGTLEIVHLVEISDDENDAVAFSPANRAATYMPQTPEANNQRYPPRSHAARTSPKHSQHSSSTYSTPPAKTPSATAPSEFANPHSCEPLPCRGRRCRKCHRCRDWHFDGDQKTWDWVVAYKTWRSRDWKHWFDVVIGNFKRRNSSTCVYGYDVTLDPTGNYEAYEGYGDGPVRFSPDGFYRLKDYENLDRSSIVGFARRVVVGDEKSKFQFLDRLDLTGDHLCMCEIH